MFSLSTRMVSAVMLVVAGLVLGGCASRAVNRAPVEDRGAAIGKFAAPVGETSVIVSPVPAPARPAAGFENAGKPGYYTVKPGDTLIRIALDHGQGAKDIARWSGVENPNRIEVGQVLRVEPPLASAASGVVTRPVTQASVTPLASAPAPATAVSKPPAPPVAATSDDEINWIWPTGGAVLAGFDELKNKGLDIGGNAGDPVLAASDGRVVYVGAGLRGYGNLIILKHNNTYLTAYAHNQTMLVKEDQSVHKGQKIAEMGSSDADRVKLHFEVRRQGKPVDPAKYLPAR